MEFGSRSQTIIQVSIYLQLLIIEMENKDTINPSHGRMEFAKKARDMTHTHVTAPTQFVEANGIRFAYRCFGIERGVPFLFMQHFRGGMDHWDPTITDGSAQTGL